ncbi:hypothetical protein LG296_12980 [Ureibacillus chungkukjangi]|uniref:hypothetical protein n=1 Tax=Ureibacillus chungkukjangi TaxID=1202712 RepID=UPI0038503A22
MSKNKHEIYEEYFVDVLESLSEWINEILKDTKYDERLKEIGVSFIHEALHEETKREIVHDVINHFNMNMVFDSILELYELFAEGVWHENKEIGESLRTPEFSVFSNLSLSPYVERLRKLG